MINMRKIILGLALCLGVFAPIAAAPAARVAVKPGIIKATAQLLLARPNLMMAGLGVASLAYAKYCGAMADGDEVSDPGVRSSYERHSELAELIGTGLLGLSANSLIQSQFKKRGYLPALSNKTAGIAAVALALGFNVFDHGLFLKSKGEIDLDDSERARQPYARQFILGGLQVCIAAGTYLYMA